MTDKQRKQWIKNARAKIYHLELRVALLEKELANERTKQRGD